MADPKIGLLVDHPSFTRQGRILPEFSFKVFIFQEVIETFQIHLFMSELYNESILIFFLILNKIYSTLGKNMIVNLKTIYTFCP